MQEQEIYTIIPHGASLANLELLGNMIARLAQETRRSYTSGNYTIARDWLQSLNAKCETLDLPQLDIDFDFITFARNKKNGKQQ